MMTPMETKGGYDIEGGGTPNKSPNNSPDSRLSPRALFIDNYNNISTHQKSSHHRQRLKHSTMVVVGEKQRQPQKSTIRRARLQIAASNLTRLVMVLGIFVLAIFFCIGSQFQTLRRLHETIPTEKNINPDSNSPNAATRVSTMLRSWLSGLPLSGGGLSEPIFLSQLPKTQYNPVIHRPNHRKFGYGLLNRIQEESVLSKTTTTKNDQATRTRTVGAAANRYYNHGNQKHPVLWPVLNPNPPQQQEQPQSNQSPNQVDSTSTSSTTTKTSSLQSSIQQFRTTTANAIRTRTMGTAANNDKNNRRAWPVLNGPVSTKPIDGGAGVAATDGVGDVNTEEEEKEASDEQARQQPDEKPPPLGSYKIVGFTDYSNREVALKWYQRLENLGYKEHVLVVYDNAMADYLESLNEEHAYYHNNSSAAADAIHGEDGSVPSDNHQATVTDPTPLEQLQQRINNNNNNNDNISSNKSFYHYRYEKNLLPPLSKTVRRLKGHKRSSRIQQIMLARRWLYVLEQLREGTSVLLSDVDAVFNERIDPTQHPVFVDFDVLHSYEGRIYDEIDDEHPETNALRYFNFQEQLGGYTLSSGISWLRSTPSTIAFVRKVVETCGTFCDDQMVLNEMMARPRFLGIEWDYVTELAANNSNNSSINNNINNNNNIPSDDLGDHHHPPLSSRSSRSGRSTVTGHRFKILDRDWVFAVDPEHPKECPTTHNWIAMPAQDTGASAAIRTQSKLASFEEWDERCETESTTSNNIQ